MSTYTVILDACVMYPAPLRGYLLYLACDILRFTNVVFLKGFKFAGWEAVSLSVFIQ